MPILILESQLAEEPFVLSGLVAILKFGLHFHPGFPSLCLILDDITSCDILIELDVN